ncbi:MAG: hypothetical protein ABJB22_00125 [Verrucomicrobiota bacterium]
MNKLYALAAAASLSFAPVIYAQDYVVLDRTADDFDRIQIQPDGTLRHIDVVSREVNVPVTVIEEQRTRTGLGYGGLFIANALAGETGRSFDEIVALKQSGRGWGVIAKQYGIKVGPIVSRLHRADSELRGKGKLKHAEKKAGKFANGHDNGHYSKGAKANGNGRAKWTGQGKAKGHGKH